MFKCDRCPYTIPYKAQLRDHIEVVHEGVIIRCPVEGCTSSFKQRSNIGHHVKQMHGTQKFKCQECDYEGPSPRAVRVHFGLTHGVKYFACEFCDFRAGYQHRINLHTRRKHAKELSENQQKSFKIITCEKCGYKSDKQRMNRHYRTWHLNTPHGLKSKATVKCHCNF